MTQLTLNQQVRGAARLRDGSGRLVLARNTFTYKAADLLANALTRRGPFQITHLYLRYNNSTTLSPLAPADGDLKKTVRADFLATSGGGSPGGFYVPLLAAPALSTNNAARYDHNVLIFYFRVPSTVDAANNGLTGGGNWDLEDSRISALGLAVAQDGRDRTGDLIFSVLQGSADGSGSFEMFPVVSNGQKAIDYPMAIDFA